jgi:hypothetical protein
LADEASKISQSSLLYHRNTNKISRHISANESISKYSRGVVRHLLPTRTEILSRRSSMDCSRLACF